MFGKSKGVGVVLMALSAAVSAQTIDEIVELNRQAAIAEAKGKVEAAKKGNGASTPLPSGMAGAGPALPLPPSPLPTGGTGPATAPAWKSMAVKKERSSQPVLMAIYGVGDNLLAELSEGGVEGKYREGDKTPGGWTVARIEKRSVDVIRHSQRKGKAAKSEKVALAFATRVEVPKEAASTGREPSTSPAGYSVPPLPPSFPASR